MIALTQEKREELIVCANEIKKMAASTHGYKVGNDSFGSNALMLMDIALASLTAEPVLHAVDSDVEDKLYTVLCDEHEDGSYPLYAAPPVPEIKLSLLQSRDLEALIRFNETCEDGEGYDLSNDKMDRLIELGVVRKIKGSIREITTLGEMYIDINYHKSPEKYLMTEKDRAAAFNQHIKRLNGLGE